MENKLNKEKSSKAVQDLQSFSITSVCKEDMKSIGFDPSRLDKKDMQDIADRLGEAYCSNGFWQDLESILIEVYKMKQHDM